MEGLKFICPKCKFELKEVYDPISDNFCPLCKQKLWNTMDTVPIIQEPQEVKNAFNELKSDYLTVGKIFNVRDFEYNKKTYSKSKFSFLERINWGASPGARKLMLGEYFTKMRLYRIDQPIVAHYLNLLRKSKNMSIQDIINKLPNKYYHTVGHWFRKDFGGSIPIPEDIELLKEVFQVQDDFLNILQKTALKFQTVKTSAKGKNPGDFIENLTNYELTKFFNSLYVSKDKYLDEILKLNIKKNLF